MNICMCASNFPYHMLVFLGLRCNRRLELRLYHTIVASPADLTRQHSAQCKCTKIGSEQEQADKSCTPPITPATMRCDKSSVAHHQSGTPAHMPQALKHTESKFCTKTKGSQALRYPLHLSTLVIHRWKGSLDHSVDTILLSFGMHKGGEEGRFKRDRAHQIIRILQRQVCVFAHCGWPPASQCEISTRGTLMVRQTVCCCLSASCVHLG